MTLQNYFGSKTLTLEKISIGISTLNQSNKVPRSNDSLAVRGTELKLKAFSNVNQIASRENKGSWKPHTKMQCTNVTHKSQMMQNPPPSSKATSS
jgi:hypothetical protein